MKPFTVSEMTSKGHSRSLAMAQFNRLHIASVSGLLVLPLHIMFYRF